MDTSLKVKYSLVLWCRNELNESQCFYFTGGKPETYESQDNRSSRWPSQLGAPSTVHWVVPFTFAKLSLLAGMASYIVGCACVIHILLIKE